MFGRIWRLTEWYRNFLTRTYPTMKKHNPHTPIMIREASGIEPTVYARFGASVMPERRDWQLTNATVDFGKEKKLPLKGLDDKAIEQQVSDLVQSTI
jgi:NADH dehydrogenase (ubiquinone) 1 alpha subcomplex subunit 2